MKTMWLGQKDYKKVLDLQLSARDNCLKEHRPTLIGCEHPNVLTLGKRSHDVHELLLKAFPQVKIQRGGQVTIHNPGQLLIYPILPWKRWELGPKALVEKLLLVTQELLENCNIIIIDNKTGLKTRSGKIASIGLNIQKGVSYHGVSINVANDLEPFRQIELCGIKEPQVTSLAQEEGCSWERKYTSIEGLYGAWVEIFLKHFHRELTS